MSGGVSGPYQVQYVSALVPVFVPVEQASQMYLVPEQPAQLKPIPVPVTFEVSDSIDSGPQQAPVDPVVLKQKKMSILGKAGWALVGLGVAVGIAAAVLFVLYNSKTVTTITNTYHKWSYTPDVTTTVSKSAMLLYSGIGAAVFAGGVFAAGSGLLIAEQMKKRKKAEVV